MGKVLGIDFGLKRTGLAISDDSKMFSFGLETVPSEKLMTYLKDLMKKENIELIVLGMPKRLNNEDSHISENVRLLKEALIKELNLPVELVDERYTSKMASETIFAGGGSKKQRKDKELIDKVSATIILQSYIDSI